jgi:2'-5' RNA ligase
MDANWFLAFPATLDGAWLEGVNAGLPKGLRGFVPEDLHATLAFLGPCGESKARAAWAEACKAPLPCFEVRFGHVEPFGPPRRPSAFGLTVEDDSGALRAAFLDHQAKLLRAAGLPPDNRPPRPHVTVARPTRAATDAERHAALSWSKGLRPPASGARLDALALYTWAKDRRAQLFVKVETLPLGAVRP